MGSDFEVMWRDLAPVGRSAASGGYFRQPWASAEVELVDAEAFMLAPFEEQPGGERAGEGRGLARMMELTNDSRLGVAMMGLGCARRALVESLTYAASREALKKSLPLFACSKVS